jgi:hypothetical protein
MAYIGSTPPSRFVSNRAVTQFSGNGSNKIFTLEQVVAQDEDILVSVDGVIQEPSVSYVVSSGTTLTFQGTDAPSANAGNNIFVYYLASQVGTIGHPSTQGLTATTGAFSSNATVAGTLGVTGAVTLGTKLATTNLATGAVVQIVNVQDGAVDTGTTVIPHDDTIPQNDEGDEFLTLAITPTSSTNKLLITTTILGSINGASYIVAALFQDSTAGALAASNTDIRAANYPATLTFSHFMTAGTTSATTFKVRVGPDSAATFTINGVGGARRFGGVAASSITITEIAV